MVRGFPSSSYRPTRRQASSTDPTLLGKRRRCISKQRYGLCLSIRPDSFESALCLPRSKEYVRVIPPYPYEHRTNGHPHSRGRVVGRAQREDRHRQPGADTERSARKPRRRDRRLVRRSRRRYACPQPTVPWFATDSDGDPNGGWSKRWSRAIAPPEKECVRSVVLSLASLGERTAETVSEAPDTLGSGGSLRASARSLPSVAPTVLTSPAVAERSAPSSPTRGDPWRRSSRN